jgi:hypothetical protein
MRWHSLSILSALALLVGCQQNESASKPASSNTPAVAAAPQPKPGDRVDVHGIVVKFLDGGAVAISGKDRWGNALDTTYENAEFFRNALPVLERSVTAEQAAGLRALIGAP